MSNQHISEVTRRRIRDWIVEERAFTCTYAAWDLTRLTGINHGGGAVKTVVDEMLGKGALKLIEDNGRAGKVYEYVEPVIPNVHRLPDRRVVLPELDASIGVGTLRPTADGTPVPHTRAEGPSGRPGRDRKRQERGVRVKRQRQGT